MHVLFTHLAPGIWLHVAVVASSQVGTGIVQLIPVNPGKHLQNGTAAGELAVAVESASGWKLLANTHSA
jgi:hypothetical protein